MRKLFTLLILVVALGATTTTILAAPPDLPPRPGIPPGPPADPPTAKVVGGILRVYVQNAGAQWVLVQWQDSLGNWITVDSWRGAFDSIDNGVGIKTWWADQSLFGPTLYRWVVYDPGSGKVVATGDPFNLPTANKQTVTSTIVLPQ